MKILRGLQLKLIKISKKLNVFRFWLLRKSLGFDAANLLLQRLDKASVKTILINNGAVIGENSDLETGLVFHNCKDYSNLIVGNNCHVGKNCFFDLRGKVVICDNVVISMRTNFITHQDVTKSGLRKIYPATYSDIIVRNSSYIGANATILQGVEIHSFAIVAAGSVVTENVSEETLVGGVPAKFIKKIVKI